jgi:hypothetical protein
MTTFIELQQMMFPGVTELDQVQYEAVLDQIMVVGARVVFRDQGGRNHCRFAILVKKTPKFYVFQEVGLVSNKVYSDLLSSAYVVSPEWDKPEGKCFRQKIGCVRCELFNEDTKYEHISHYS